MLPLISRRPSEWLRRGIELLLLLALLALMTRWFTTIFSGAVLPAPPTANMAPDPSSINRINAMLASARFFGAHAPGTLSDNVQALGIIADPSPGGRGGSAIISVDGHPPRAYRLGSDVEGRRLTAIRPGEIELENGGARQVFRLPPKTSTNVMPGMGSSPMPKPQAAMPAALPAAMMPPPSQGLAPGMSAPPVPAH